MGERFAAYCKPLPLLVCSAFRFIMLSCARSVCGSRMAPMTPENSRMATIEKSPNHKVGSIGAALELLADHCCWEGMDAAAFKDLGSIAHDMLL